MSNPQQFRPDMVILSDEETARVVAFVTRVGKMGEARKRLGLSPHTFDAARGFGRMRVRTRARVLDALEREER